MKRQLIHCVPAKEKHLLDVFDYKLNTTTFREEGKVDFPISGGFKVRLRVEKFPSDVEWKTVDESK